MSLFLALLFAGGAALSSRIIHDPVRKRCHELWSLTAAALVAFAAAAFVALTAASFVTTAVVLPLAAAALALRVRTHGDD